jgi:hypothetical protein
MTIEQILIIAVLSAGALAGWILCAIYIFLRLFNKK